MLQFVEKTYWNTINPNYKSYPKLSSSSYCDVAVIGGGIAGALTAYFLAQHNVNTMLLEENTVASGNTLKSTGLLLYEASDSLKSQINKVGEENAVRSYKLGQKAIDEIEILLRNIGKSADFHRQNYTVVGKPLPSVCPSFQEEQVLRTTYHFETANTCGNTQFQKFSYPTSNVLCSKLEAVIDPFRFAHVLLKAGTQKGVRIYEHTPALNFNFSKDKIRINTPNYFVECKKVVFATPYTLTSLLPKNKLMLQPVFCIVTNSITDLKLPIIHNILKIQADEDFYIRTTSDNRILLVELNNQPASSQHTPESLQQHGMRLLTKLQSFFPDLHNIQVEYQWCSILGHTADNLPYIGCHPSYPNCYFNFNYGINDVINGFIGSQIIKDLILYNSQPDAKIFSFTR